MKILVVRIDNIGDLVCTTPLIRALRARFPDGHIAALVNSYNEPILSGNRDVDRVYAYTKAKHRPAGQSSARVYWDLVRLMLQLRREQFDYALIACASFAPRPLAFARAAKPRHIIGFTDLQRAREGRSIDCSIPYHTPRPMHEVEDVFRLLAPLGIDGPPPPLQLVPDASEVARLRLIAGNAGATGLTIGVHVSARKPSNRWPIERHVELVKRLHMKYCARFMLFWSPGSNANPHHPGDDESAERIMSALNGIPVTPCPTHRLEELIAGLSLCDEVVCSDGGAMHIAAALGKPIVCFFGDSDRTHWYPWGVPHVLLQTETRDAKEISVDDAVSAYDRLRKQLAERSDYTTSMADWR